jgi:hypothetical protein
MSPIKTNSTIIQYLAELTRILSPPTPLPLLGAQRRGNPRMENREPIPLNINTLYFDIVSDFDIRI